MECTCCPEGAAVLRVRVRCEIQNQQVQVQVQVQESRARRASCEQGCARFPPEHREEAALPSYVEPASC